MKSSRRDFIKKSSMSLAAAGMASAIPSILKANAIKKEMSFKLALSQFSLASQFWTKQLDPLDFPKKTITTFGIPSLDYCSMFFADKAKDATFLNELKKRALDNGCYNLRIMVDGEGVLGDLNKDVRTKAVENHYKWIDAAATLGCPMIRVNVEGEGDPDEVAKAAIESLNTLIDYGKKSNIDVIVENHIGISCNAGWLAAVMKKMNNPHWEMATITVLVDIIIPKDERSGSATDAKVPEFIEFIVKDEPEHQLPLRGGLKWLDVKCLNRYGNEFKSCIPTQQTEMIAAIAYPSLATPEMQPGVAFLNKIRDLTAAGFFTSKMGIEDLGYKGNTPNQWKGVPPEILKQYGLENV